MDINQLRTTKKMADLQPTACTFVPGLGYVRLGEHRFPDKVRCPPSDCLPPDDAQDGTIGSFIVPGAAVATVRMFWRAEQKLWQPISPLSANRLAFKPAYLAAHGWKLDNG